MIRDQLISFLSTNVLAAGKRPTPKQLIKAMKENKETLFYPEDFPKHHMGPIHSLYLQLVTKSVITVGIREESVTKIGTNKLLLEDFVVSLPNGTNENGILLPAYTITEFWNGLNII